MSSFFLTHSSPTHIYTLSLHDALPISIVQATTHFDDPKVLLEVSQDLGGAMKGLAIAAMTEAEMLQKRSEEHTSELQSLTNLVCRLLLEKKKKTNNRKT